MNIYVLPSADDVAKKAADIIQKRLQTKPDLVLGLATGSTPIPLYQELIKRYKAGQISFGNVTSFNLDEYVPLPAHHPQSYHFFMNENLFNHVNIPKQNTHVPQGVFTGVDLCSAEVNSDPSVSGYCQWYEEAIKKAGGVDVQVLGIGSNGHLAFNEPGSSLNSRTRIIKLTEQTRKDNSRLFDGDLSQVPTHAISMGMGTIMESKELILLATGAGKADAIAAATSGAISSLCPSSIVQWHPAAHIIIDKSAAAKLHPLLLERAYFT